ncbi:MAG: hypothetical protein KDA60_21025 [Planctomycetales bacterium]|nr:hypothetical protein [Planctomycetales bacterium]
MNLQVTVRTPNALVLQQSVDSLRVPTQTGQVGLRARCERSVLAVEPGLIVCRGGDGEFFAGTAGGLLRTDGRMATLLTPIAVAGSDVDEVTHRLDDLLSTPTEEAEIRRALEQVENQILQELNEPARASRSPPTRHR